jgi:uroporphyrinogen-III synthase
MRALVTRPAEDAAVLAAALAARGIEPLLEPLLAIRAAADAPPLAPLLDGAQAILFTSANGVRAFAAASSVRALPAFAVGDATAAAARALNFTNVASAGGNVGDLARLVRDRLRPEGGALLHATARAVAGDLARSLDGFAVRRAVLYEAVPATRLGGEATALLRAGRVPLALFFSPRTAATFVRLAHGAGLVEACRAVVAIGLSRAVADALGSFAWRAVAIADAPTETALIAALDRIIAARQDLSP